MTTTELILKQIRFLRRCMDEKAAAAADYASAKNEYEAADAQAGARIYGGGAVYNDDGEEIKLTNDISRKAYIKDHALVQSQMMNIAKECRDTAEKRVDVEVSVLSALKQIATSEAIDDSLLAKYDLMPGEDGV
jgi:hypothetical protein